MRVHLAVAIFVSLFDLSSLSLVSAQTVTFEFTGVVTSSDLPEFVALDTVTGQYTFISSTVDSDAAPNAGLYKPGVTSYSISFSSGYSAVFDTDGALTDIQVLDDDPLDIYSVLANVSGSSVNGFAPEISTINTLRETPGGTFITSPALPTTPPDLALADIKEGALRFSGNNYVHYDIQTLALPTAGGFTDYDDDGTWNLGDLNLVLFNWQKSKLSLPDTWVNQRPDVVGLDSVNTVLFNWLQASSSSLAVVPEPASLTLALVSVLALLGVARKS